MRWSVSLVLMAATVASAAPGLSGSLDESEGGELGDREPALVSVRARLRGEIATFVARYVVDVDGPTHDAQLAYLELPRTGLVTGATVVRDGRAHRLALVPAERAGEAFASLGTEDARGERRSAVLIARDREGVELGIASPRPGQLVVDLEVSAPTCFFADARYVAVPERWAAVAPRGLRPPPTATGDALTATCELTGAVGPWLAFPSEELLRRRSGDRFGATAARLDAGADHLVRVELDVAGTLGDIPRDLATAIVVDASRSLSDDEREAQRALVAAYLETTRDARVQVIAFTRDAKALLPAWRQAANARAEIDRALRALVPRNGSNLDRGLVEAGAWLQHVEGTRRVLVLTDERMAQRLLDLGPTALARHLPEGTLVHAVALTRTQGTFDREDQTWLAPLATSRGGMGVQLGPPVPGIPLDATMLARPTSLDHVRVAATGWTAMSIGAELACGATGIDRLEEGGSCTWWGRGAATSSTITVEGMVWGQRVSRVLRPDPSRGLEVARELSARDAPLEVELMERIDQLARAVNNAWSLYAEWGGRGAYEAPWGYRAACGCDGSLGHTSSAHVGHAIVVDRPQLDLKAQLADAIAHCGLGDASATVHLELTMQEIADVKVKVVPGRGATAATMEPLARCIREAIWNAEPVIGKPLPHTTHTVTFGR